MRIFIDNIDSYVGKALCADLRSVLGQDNRLFGTVQDEGVEIDLALVQSLGVKRVIPRVDREKYFDDLLSCGLIVFDLHSANPLDVEMVIKHLKLVKLEHETTFVLISSVNVWARTIRGDSGYVKPEVGEDEEPPADDEDAPQSEDQNLALTVLPNGELRLPSGATTRFKETKRPRIFTDKDKDLRTPAEEYELWKYLETLTLSLGPKEKLRPHVVCSGILYGNGETVLNDLFKAAWLTQPTHVISRNRRGDDLEPGTNYVPCVHVRDVARLIRVVAVDSKVPSYLIAVDRSRLTQTDIVLAIVNQISHSREIPLVDSAHAYPDNPVLMTRLNNGGELDIILEPSAPMRAKQFDWWCKKGLAANIEKVAAEFCRWRNLLPLKTLVLGPPGSGGERLSKQIAERYLHQDPPLLTFDQILQDALAAGKETKLQAKVDILRNNPGRKLKLSTRTRLVKKRLLTNVCRYRGYVLEGYPSSFEEAQALFTEKVPDEDEPPPEEEEEESEPEEEEAAPPPPGEEDEDEPEPIDGSTEPKRRVAQAIAPEFVVVLSSNTEHCRQRIFEGKSTFHGGEEEFVRLTEEYRQNNLMDDGSAGTAAFFEEVANLRVLRTDVDNQTEDELFQTVRVHLESKGTFFNYLRSDEEIIREKQAQREAIEAQIAAQRQQEQDETRTRENALLDIRALEEQSRRKVIAEGEAARLDKESLPLRTYLMHHVVPTLSNGLTEVCREMPEDPIEALAQYLFAHAQDIAPQLARASAQL